MLRFSSDTNLWISTARPVRPFPSLAWSTTNQLGRQLQPLPLASYRCVAFATAEAFLEPTDLGNPERQMHCSIPIIFLTGHADESVRAKALNQGALAFLSKPFSDEALLSVIRSTLESPRNQASHGEVASMRPATFRAHLPLAASSEAIANRSPRLYQGMIVRLPNQI